MVAAAHTVAVDPTEHRIRAMVRMVAAVRTEAAVHEECRTQAIVHTVASVHAQLHRQATVRMAVRDLAERLMPATARMEAAALTEAAAHMAARVPREFLAEQPESSNVRLDGLLHWGLMEVLAGHIVLTEAPVTQHIERRRIRMDRHTEQAIRHTEQVLLLMAPAMRLLFIQPRVIQRRVTPIATEAMGTCLL